MRIIGGEARSRTIQAPRGMDTRPTRDNVRESLFNILMRDCPGARVLDLFAGSGALGLEAISRGASSAVLVDAAREAAAVIGQNARALGFADRARVLCMDYRAALEQLARAGERFDLVFLDPPYRMEAGTACETLARLSLLDAGALLVVEHAAKTPPPVPPGFRASDLRRYRDTAVTFLIWEG